MSTDSQQQREEQIKTQFEKMKKHRKMYTTLISVITSLGWVILVVDNYDKVWPYASIIGACAVIIFCVWRYSVITHAIQIAFAAFSANQVQEPVPRKSARKGFRR
jgi:hypothetical protein